MRIADLDNSLPNGFHDSTLQSMSVKLDEGMLEFVLDVSVGDAEGTSDERERYRLARLLITGVAYVFVDPPGPGSAWTSRASMIDLCDAEPAVSARFGAPQGGFAARFFVADWNAFIHFAGMDVTLTWADGV